MVLGVGVCFCFSSILKKCQSLGLVQEYFKESLSISFHLAGLMACTKVVWFCWSNPLFSFFFSFFFFLFQNSRGTASLLKDSISFTEVSASGLFEGHDLLRRGYALLLHAELCHRQCWTSVNVKCWLFTEVSSQVCCKQVSTSLILFFRKETAKYW